MPSRRGSKTGNIRGKDLNVALRLTKEVLELQWLSVLMTSLHSRPSLCCCMEFMRLAFDFIIREGNFKCIPRLERFSNFLSRTAVKMSAIWEDLWCGRVQEADEGLARTRVCCQDD